MQKASGSKIMQSTFSSTTTNIYYYCWTALLVWWCHSCCWVGPSTPNASSFCINIMNGVQAWELKPKPTPPLSSVTRPRRQLHYDSNHHHHHHPTSPSASSSTTSSTTSATRTEKSTTTRRGWLGQAAAVVVCSGTSSGTLLVAGSGDQAWAASSPTGGGGGDDALFRQNPLTNPVLEQIRIWEQAEADNIKYNGELERGDAGNNKGQVDAYPRLLVPILGIAQDLNAVEQCIVALSSSSSSSGNKTQQLQHARQILSKPEFEKITFKKIFNKYGDNIYYSDPDRANAYLGGGAVPKNEQSLAYLLRNEILTTVEDMQAELDYLLKNNDSLDDLQGMIRTAQMAMKKYLDVVPPRELEKAQELLQQEEETTKAAAA